MKTVSVLTCLLILAALSGCGSTILTQKLPYDDASFNKPRKVAIFLYGTGDDPSKRSNVIRLFDLTADQKTNSVTAFYTEGVGTDTRFGGLVVGWGIGKDVRDAYNFISQNYRNNQDSLYIFGFSRGSYAARMLGGFIYVAGVANNAELSPKERESFVYELYEAYKGKNTINEKRASVQVVLDKWHAIQIRDVRIERMGIWDTVEALGLPDYKEDVGEVNTRYVDQICNVGKVYHAVALDDNRARIYTPILMTDSHVNRLCPEVSIDDTVEEVWFSGAHADVGGGYSEGELPGVSLNWMINNIRDTGLLQGNPSVNQDEYDVIHDAEADSILYKLAFKRLRRHPDEYLKNSSYNKQHIKVHQSVIARLSKIKTLVQKRIDHRKRGQEKFKAYDSEWYTAKPFTSCFSGFI